MIRQVHLVGTLQEKFGAGPYRFKANNMRELIAGLTAIHPTFRREIIKHHDIAVLKTRGNEAVFMQPEELDFQFGNWTDLHVAVGEFGSAEGAAAVAAYFAQAGTAAYYAVYAVAYVAITVAVSFGVSTVLQSLSDVPDVKEGRRADNKSTLFQGPDNRETQGGRVQLVYGRFRVGSYTLSQSISARRQPIGLDDSITLTSGTTSTINIFSNDVATTAPVVTNFVVDGITTAVGGTYTSLYYTVSVDAAGTVTVVSTDTPSAQFLVLINGTDTGIDFTNSLAVTINEDYDYYDYGGGADGGGGEDGGFSGGDF